MRKLIPVLFCGFAALSYGALAADKDAEAEARAKAQAGTTVQGTGNAGSEVRGDANAGASTSSDNAVSEKKGNEVHGATKDSHTSHPKADEQAKDEAKDRPAAGATSR